MEPITFLSAVAVLSLVTVESGGWALLGFITKRRGALTPFQERFFRAGHAHAGTLLVLSLAALTLFDRTGLDDSGRWAWGAALLTGVLLQSGGFFVHLALGREGVASIGTKITRLGGLLI